MTNERRIVFNMDILPQRTFFCLQHSKVLAQVTSLGVIYWPLIVKENNYPLYLRLISGSLNGLFHAIYHHI